jgi:hypothetical protein
MTAKKQTPARHKPAVPTFEPPTEQPAPRPEVSASGPDTPPDRPEETVSDQAPDRPEVSGRDADTPEGPPDFPSGQPVALPQTAGELPRESALPGDPNAAKNTAAPAGPVLVGQGTYAVYEDGKGGYMLVTTDAEGNVAQQPVPAMIVAAARGEGMMGNMPGVGRIRKLLGL